MVGCIRFRFRTMLHTYFVHLIYVPGDADELTTFKIILLSAAVFFLILKINFCSSKCGTASILHVSFKEEHLFSIISCLCRLESTLRFTPNLTAQHLHYFTVTIPGFYVMLDVLFFKMSI